MDSILNDLNLEKLNIKDLTILLEVLNNIKIENSTKDDDLEVI